jgi:hypothetical protein
MRWLKRKLRNWINSDDLMCEVVHSRDVHSASLQSNGFRLQVYKASGGIVVETSVYDERKDRHSQGLHVITEDKDLGEAISKIITYENLKL